MIERQSEIENLQEELRSTLGEIRDREAQLAMGNNLSLFKAATKLTALGLFPTRKVVFNSDEREYDIYTISLMKVGFDDESERDVYVDGRGRLHLCYLVPGRDEPIVDFTGADGLVSDKHYVSHTKQAIRLLMQETDKALQEAGTTSN